ncbi:MAG: ABC transporter substrate-binding protein [Ignavibacteria bacterium]
MKRKIFYAFAFLLTGMMLFSSCGRQKEDTNAKKEATKDASNFELTELAPPDVEGAVVGDWIIRQEMSDAQKLNPTVTNDAAASGIYIYIFEPLIDIDRITYEIKPIIAKAPPTLSEDHMTYTFDLKENVTFSDGKPLTGEDVIFTIKTIKNPFTDAQALRNYFNDVKSVELVDGNKYKIRINMSKPYFKAIYTIGGTAITAKHILDKDNMNDSFTWEDLNAAALSMDPKKYPKMQEYAEFLNSQKVSREPEYLVGSGPYILDKWITGQSVTLSRNDNYWNKKEIPNFPAKLIFKTIQDQNAAGRSCQE